MAQDLDQDEQRFQRAATGLIGGLFVLVKLALVHRMDNAAVAPAIVRFHESLAPMHEAAGGQAALQFVADAVYINQRLVHADLATWERARFLRAFFARLDIGEIAFDAEVAPETLREFLQGVREAALDPARAGEVRQRAFRGLAFRKLDAVGSAAAEAIVVPDKVR